MYKYLMTAAIAAATVASAASAQVATYTNSGSFSSAVSGATNNTFTFQPSYTDLGTSYSVGSTTFASADVVGYNDAYGVPYLGSYGDLTVTTDASAIGFNFGSYGDAQTITYIVDGVTGTLDLPGNHSGTAFLGFSGLSGLTTLSFSNNNELDTTSFVTAMSGAVPEPATWAMMLLGFAAIGVAMRRKPSQALAQTA